VGCGTRTQQVSAIVSAAVPNIARTMPNTPVLVESLRHPSESRHVGDRGRHGGGRVDRQPASHHVPRAQA